MRKLFIQFALIHKNIESNLIVNYGIYENPKPSHIAY